MTDDSNAFSSVIFRNVNGPSKFQRAKHGCIRTCKPCCQLWDACPLLIFHDPLLSGRSQCGTDCTAGLQAQVAEEAAGSVRNGSQKQY